MPVSAGVEFGCEAESHCRVAVCVAGVPLVEVPVERRRASIRSPVELYTP